MDVSVELSKTILIVEDEESLLTALQVKLSDAGFRVVAAKDGVEGLAQSLALHPDVIILDILMPRMNGLAMLDKLRNDPWGKSVHVILLSNLEASDERLNKIVLDQPSYYLIKTNTTLDEVTEKVRELVTEK